MIRLPEFAGRTVAVLGLARSGLATVAALMASGATVVAWDDAEPARARAAAAGVTLRPPQPGDVAGWACLVMSPGIPLTHPPHPLALAARAARVPVIGDIELLWRAGTGARFIGITGTNGKSTTTALIAHCLATAGRAHAVGGNLGIPALSLPALGPDGIYVLELSSFQLDLVDTARFDIAVLLNVTPDHLDRHGDMAGYIAAKERIFRHQGAADLAIVGIDDAPCRAVADRLVSAGNRIVTLSAAGTEQAGVGVEVGMLIDATGATPRTVLDLRTVPALPGQHNWQNMAAAYAACRAAGLDADAITAGIRSFPGLPHRLETVGRIGRTRFVNDSKATNAEATEKALLCFDGIHWIAGGRAKAGGIDSLLPHLGRVAAVYLIGEAEAAFAHTIGDRVPVHRCGTLEAAVVAALSNATAARAEAPVVLLSPACASFDQFTDFEARGDAFRAIVAALAEGTPL